MGPAVGSLVPFQFGLIPATKRAGIIMGRLISDLGSLVTQTIWPKAIAGTRRVGLTTSLDAVEYACEALVQEAEINAKAQGIISNQFECPRTHIIRFTLPRRPCHEFHDPCPRTDGKRTKRFEVATKAMETFNNILLALEIPYKSIESLPESPQESPNYKPLVAALLELSLTDSVDQFGDLSEDMSETELIALYFLRGINLMSN